MVDIKEYDNTHRQHPQREAKEEHENLVNENCTPNVLHIYTDGSGIDDYVGAAAHSPTISAVVHHHLGKADSTNVYAAELTAIHLGIKLTSDVTRSVYRGIRQRIESKSQMPPVSDLRGCKITMRHSQSVQWHSEIRSTERKQLG
jgi:hypothetical protein